MNTLTWVALVWCVVGAVYTFFVAKNRSNSRGRRWASVVLCVLNIAAAGLNAATLAGVLK